MECGNGIYADTLKRLKLCVAGSESHSYGTSLAIWDRAVLPATRHK